jgi:hypothetical protein
MPTNPQRSKRGGDVDGMFTMDATNASGPSIKVARASIDPGYDLDSTLQNTPPDALLRGYSDYGVTIGDGSTNKHDKTYDLPSGKSKV